MCPNQVAASGARPASGSGTSSGTGPGGIPILMKTLGKVVEAPKVRLGAVTHDAMGETVVGVAMMQYGANANKVVEAVTTPLGELAQTLPRGV